MQAGNGAYNGAMMTSASAVLMLACMVLAEQSQPGRRAPTRDGFQGSPLWSAFIMGSSIRMNDSLSELKPEARQAVEQRLQQRRAYKPRLRVPSSARGIQAEMHAARQQWEGAIVALTGAAGVEAEAVAYAKDAVLFYEWEGYSDGPMTEAGFAERYLRDHPQTALAPFLDLFLLHRYRSAFEAAGHEGKPDIQRTAAERYRDVFDRLARRTDPVIGAVADDIDAERFLYVRTDQHPRTFGLPGIRIVADTDNQHRAHRAHRVKKSSL